MNNTNRPREREAAIRLSNLRGKVREDGGKGKRSTKGLVYIHMGLASGHGQWGWGWGISREGFGMGMGE